MNAEELVADYIYALENTIWCQPAVITLDPQAHVAKMRDLVPLYDGDEDLAEPTMEWMNKLRTGRTHGDCTFDNLMHDSSGNVRIIDPIPPTRAVPDIIAVDMGKILMSLVGFEMVRYGTPMVSRAEAGIELLKKAAGSRLEWRATRYWCAVHLFRAAPYMPTKEVADGVRSLAHYVLTHHL